MVKYLSDNRTDQRYQTILSRSQPFQGEVAEQRYPVTETDLGPSLKMMQTLGSAYVANEEEELQRERIKINYEMGQARQAGAQAKSDKAQKEKMLTATIKNDLYMTLNNLVNRYDQKLETTQSLDRKVRDVSIEYLKNGGAYLDADDVTKIQRDLGVNITGDLIKARMDLEKEAVTEQNKQIKEDVTNYAKLVGADLLSFDEKMEMYVADRSATITLQNTSANDAIVQDNSQDPKIINSGQTYISPETQTSAINYAAGKLQHLLKMRYNETGGVGPDSEMMTRDYNFVRDLIISETGGRLSDEGMLNRIVRLAGYKVGYTGDVNFLNAQLEASAKASNDRLTLEQNTTKRIENQNALQDAALMRRIRNNPNTGSLSLFISLGKDLGPAAYEKSMEFADQVDAELIALANRGKVQSVDMGGVYAKTVNDFASSGNPKLTGQAYQNAQDYAQWAYSVFADDTRFNYYDRGSALVASQNDLTVLQRGDDSFGKPGVEAKWKNTGVNTDRYRSLYDNGDMKYYSPEEKNRLFETVYMPNRNNTAVLAMNDITNGVFKDHVKFDRRSNKLVGVNFGELSTVSRMQQLPFQEEIDVLNQFINDGKYSEYKGKETADDFRDALLESYGIQDTTETDVIHHMSATVDLARNMAKGDTREAVKDIIPVTKEVAENALYNIPKDVTEAYTNLIQDVQKETEGMSEEEKHEALISAVSDIMKGTSNFLASLRGEQPKYENKTPGQKIAELEAETQKVLEEQEKFKNAVQTIEESYTGNIALEQVPAKQLGIIKTKIGDKEVLLPGTSQTKALNEYNKTGKTFGIYDSAEEADNVLEALQVQQEFREKVLDEYKEEIKAKTGMSYTGTDTNPLDTVFKATKYIPVGNSDQTIQQTDFQFIKKGGKWYLEALPNGSDAEAKQYLENTGNYLAVANTKDAIEKQAEALMEATYNKPEPEGDTKKVRKAITIFDAYGRQMGPTSAEDIETGETVYSNSAPGYDNVWGTQGYEKPMPSKQPEGLEFLIDYDQSKDAQKKTSLTE